ncbi:PH domain-containing protein [Streptosporangium fragile]|uniref:PH domain-containing protein n=1 Tax=Streptosporangium fragile TaxID=46186 RepID=A0ABN3VXY6_9ACTN
MSDRADEHSAVAGETAPAAPAGEPGRRAAGRVRFPLRDPANRVSRKAITMWLVEGLFWSVLLLAGSFFLARWIEGDRWSWLPDWVLDNVWWLPALTVLLLLPAALVEPFWRYAVHRWELSGDVVYARSGWISREWVFVPVSRIQTVDKAQGWIERMLGLATVEIRTASHAGSSTIKGLDYGVAAELAAVLAHRAEELRDDAT